MEVWRDIQGYEGLYQVSNKGRVKSVERYDSLGRAVKERILYQHKEKKGYMRVSLSKFGIQSYFKVHRLVANAFIENHDKLPQINHIDEDKCNNTVSNLEWCTNQYNSSYGTRVDRILSSRGQSRKQKPNGRRKISQYTRDGVLLKTWDNAKEVKKSIGIDNGDIAKCCKGIYKQVGGYRWKYA